MSSNIVPVNLKVVYDPRTKQLPRSYGILKGGRELLWQQFTAQSLASNGATFQCNPPNRQVFTNRKIYISGIFDIAFTGTVPSGNLIQLGVSDAPRSWALTKCIKNAQVQLGQDSTSVPLNDYFTALERFHNNHETRWKDYSIANGMMDQYQEYSDYALYGSSKNALADYGETSTSDDGRAGYSGLNLLTNTPTSATATLQVCEPLIVSPLIFGKEEGAGIYGIDSIQIQLDFSSLARVWCHDNISLGSGRFSSITVTPRQGSFKALLNFIQPDITMPLPVSQTWPYSEVIRYPTNGPTLGPGQSSDIVTNAIQLKTIPRKLYIFARQQNNDLNESSTDTFAVINNMNITFNTRNGILASATPYDLYNISVRNGLEMSWSQFSLYVGSVVCLESGMDIPLSEVEAPGLVGNYQLTVGFNITNPHNTQTITYTAFIVVINEGSYSVVNGSAIKQIGVVTHEDALNAYTLPEATYKASESSYGGDFFGSIKRFFDPVVSAVKTVAPYVKTAYDVGKTVAPLLGIGVLGGRKCPKNMHASYAKHCVKNRKKSKKRSKKSRKGRGYLMGDGIYGGEFIDRNQLTYADRVSESDGYESQ